MIAVVLSMPKYLPSYILRKGKRKPLWIPYSLEPIFPSPAVHSCRIVRISSPLPNFPLSSIIPSLKWLWGCPYLHVKTTWTILSPHQLEVSSSIWHCWSHPALGTTLLHQLPWHLLTLQVLILLLWLLFSVFFAVSFSLTQPQNGGVPWSSIMDSVLFVFSP